MNYIIHNVFIDYAILNVFSDPKLYFKLCNSKHVSEFHNPSINILDISNIHMEVGARSNCHNEIANIQTQMYRCPQTNWTRKKQPL